MNYRTDRYGNQLSILGFGCMRFPHKLGRIDMDETEKTRRIDTDGVFVQIGRTPDTAIV